jgi:hypothetical protein
MRKVGLAIIAVGLMAAGLALARSVPVARASDELPYEWTCKAQGYFAMAVEADGNVTPSVDRSETQPISVTINKRQETALTPERILLPFDLGYVLGLASQPETMFSVAPDWWRPFGVRVHLGPEGLDAVSAIFFPETYSPRPSVLTLKKSDKDWVFSVYSGDLTTDTEARRLKVETRSTLAASQIREQAATYFMTGPCVRRR